MKKIILKLLKKYFELIASHWTEKFLQSFGLKLSATQMHTLVNTSINVIMEVIETSDYNRADQYLIDCYNLFSSAKLNLLEISQFFSQGRHSISTYIENDKTHKYDPLIIIGFMDGIIEQIFARYGMLHQEAEMKGLALDRDRLAAKLEMNQQYLKNILHSSDSAIMIIDNNEKFIAWNRGAEKIFSFTEEEVLGRPSSLLLPDEERYNEELKYIREEVQKNGYVRILETERRTKFGKIVSVELNVTKLPANNGEYTGRSVIIKDFTEVKKLKEQVDQSEKLAVLGQLAAGVAHEIGNPLTSISALVQILQRRNQDEFSIEQLANIKTNIDRISKIVRELVDFSRPPGYEERLIEITDVIKTALGIVKYDKRVKKVEFQTNLAPDLPKISIVPDQLLQIYINILINAIDAIGGNGTIKVNSYKDKKYIYTEIIDNGCGINKNVIDKIFDPFFTTKEVGKGTGLGLSVSYGIVKKFKGDILVNSEVNVGSSFTLQLPINQNLMME